MAPSRGPAPVSTFPITKENQSDMAVPYSGQEVEETIYAPYELNGGEGQDDSERTCRKGDKIEGRLPTSSEMEKAEASPDRRTGRSDSTTFDPSSSGVAKMDRPVLSQARKYVLLTVFCVGVFIDVMGVCAFYILTGPVALDLGIQFEAQTWIITSFAVTFAAFLLFWGRVSDLYSPVPVFGYAFLALGVLNLIISFQTDQYAFLILRALSGIAGSAMIPSSYRLISKVFEEHELARAFTIYGLCGSLGASLGVPIGGLVELIRQGGQMSGWRWYFRITTALIIPIALWSLKEFPKQRGEAAGESQKWKRLDFPGTLIMLFAILLLILGLTLGASYGFGTAYFLVPFIISLPFFPLFFFWQSRLPANLALIPSALWRVRNFTLWTVLAIFTSAWWTCNQVPLIEVYVREHGDPSIIAAMRILPEGISSLVCSCILITFPVICANPRWTYTIGQIGGMVAYVLFIYSEGQVGNQYWKFGFPAATLGSFCNNLAATSVIVGAMTTSPSSQAGVVGAILQTAIQAGNAIALTVQAGLFTIHPGGIADFRNVQASFWFMFAWGGVCIAGFWVFYRKPERKEGEEERKVITAH